MQHIVSLEDLKSSISTLEIELDIKEQILKDQFVITYESLKPVNLIRKVLNELSSSPYLLENIPGTTIGLLSGFLSKKLFVGQSGNTTRKFFGSVLQFGITNFISHNSETIKSVGKIISHFATKRSELKSLKKIQSDQM